MKEKIMLLYLPKSLETKHFATYSLIDSDVPSLGYLYPFAVFPSLPTFPLLSTYSNQTIEQFIS